MATTGTITIAGKEFSWSSPTLAALEQFEAKVGRISDPGVVNSVTGRIWLCWLCLRDHHPDLTVKSIGEFPGEAWNPIWEMIQQALPLWGNPPGEGEKEKTSTSPDTSASPAPDSSGGRPPSPDASA